MRPRVTSLLRFAALGACLTLPRVALGQDDLQKCAKPIGTLAVVEPASASLSSLSRYSLGSPGALIKMMVQQSNCFVVVERGAAMANMQQERSLAASGEMQQTENMGGGMMKAADFILTPAVQITNNDAGGMGAAVGGLLSRAPVIGAIGAATKIKEAETSMTIADARTTVQVAGAQGKARKTDFKLGLGALAGPLAAVIGGYTNTAEGKLIAASFRDNLNNIVTSMKENSTLMARADRFKPAGLEGDLLKAGATFADGVVLAPKIDNVKLFDAPKGDAKVVATLKKGTELIYLGTETDGFVHVQGADGEGWVRKVLVAKK